MDDHTEVMATLDELRSIKDLTQRARAANDELNNLRDQMSQVALLRSETVAALIKSLGAALAAEQLGVSRQRVYQLARSS